MYDKEYAETWIKHSDSEKGYYRKKFLYPYMKKILRNIKPKAKVVDIGCGWGVALDYLDKDYDYLGIDPTKQFFPYIKKKCNRRKIELKEGSLPNNIPVKSNSYDLVICSLALHCVSDLSSSIKTIFDKAKNGAKVILTDFRDDAEPIIRKEHFIRIDEDTGKYLKGLFFLSDSAKLIIEIYLHKENQIEKDLSKYSYFKKEYLGPTFVAYECMKK